MSLEEIAKALDMRLGTVKSSLHRAMHRLRDAAGRGCAHEPPPLRAPAAAREAAGGEAPGRRRARGGAGPRRRLSGCGRALAEIRELLAPLSPSDPARRAELPIPLGAARGPRPRAARRDDRLAAGPALAGRSLPRSPPRPSLARPRLLLARAARASQRLRAGRHGLRGRRCGADRAAPWRGEQAVRYLSEAQDVLVTRRRHAARLPRDEQRVDLGEEARRSRELLARRALLVDWSDGAELASARPVLEDVEQMLREVAALESCARPATCEAIHEEIGRSAGC